MLYYLPLEPYEERYTAQLRRWTEDRLTQAKVPYQVVDGQRLAGTEHVTTGVALDAHGRSYFGLTQMAALVPLTQQMTDRDVIYMQDMYQPGYESLPYIISQLPKDQRPRVYTHCWAQSIDPNDFTFPMRRWMRHYEMMVDKTIDGVFMASTCMVDMLRASLFEAPLHVVGQPFDIGEVQDRVPNRKPLKERSRRVVFTSRWDKEKQPWFYLELIKRAKQLPLLETFEFALCTSQPKLRSNYPGAVDAARQASTLGELYIYEGLTKNQYYGLLADSRVHFMCSLQDFVSFALVEASALGTPTLAPAFLSFPEALFNNPDQMYMPWSVDNALEQLGRLIAMPPSTATIQRPAFNAHRSLDRIIERIKLDGSTA